MTSVANKTPEGSGIHLAHHLEYRCFESKCSTSFAIGWFTCMYFAQDTYEPFIEEATKVLERLPESTSDEGKKCDGEAKAPKDANGGAKESDADSEKAPEAKEAQDAMVESSQTEEVDACDPIVGSSPAKETDEAVSKSQTGKADSDGNGGDEK